MGVVSMRALQRWCVLILFFSFVGKPLPDETILPLSLLSNSQDCL